MSTGLRFTLEVDGLPPDAFAVVSFHLNQSLSSLFSLDLSLVSQQFLSLEFQQILDKMAYLTIWQGDDVQRRVKGVVTWFELGENDKNQKLYSMKVCPPLWRTGLRQNFRIFQNEDIESILGTILQENGVTEWSPLFSEPHPSREFCVQYGETDYDFLCRMAAEEGIFFYEEHAQKSTDQSLVLCDNWMRDCHTSDDKDVIAIDGKTLRHSYDKSRRKGAIHVISAFSTMHSLVIGQIRTDEKSNEITAIPELLNMLDIKGKIITTDAMGCQKDIAEKIQKQGGDYLFAVKGNQGRLNKAFEEKFPLKELNNPEHDSYAISEKSHGREEIRLHIVCDVPDELIDFTFEWKGLKKLCVAVSFRSIIAEQKKEPEMTVRYYISSADLTAEKFATAIRNHWHVENKLHRRLDVVMNEDDYKIRRGNAAELFSGIRHIAINILTNEKVFKAGLKRKIRKAAMDRNYLASVLAGSGLS
ncbi:ISAs1 family transposase [Escherichia coli]|nr:ISAs1 family transposase [Escherichia coli]